ncbi:hypothetical protein AB0O31_11490 [Kitasatospora cineracea]|uniref:hypothetical protein n=1 Tax=Kitasatospora cineracea TaxID=88074 RepID=UPI003447E4F9
MSNSSPNLIPATNARALNAAEMIQMAAASQDPIRRAQILADAQSQLAFALRSAVGECVDNKRSWSEIGQAIGMSKESAWRQWDSQGPIVSVRATQTKAAATTADMPTEAIYAFQTEAGTWIGPHDALPDGEFKTAAMPFNPPNPETNRFAAQSLRARYGLLDGNEVSFQAALVIEPDGTQRRVRVTDQILNLLFGDGQTALRRALTALVHASIYSTDVDPGFRELVENAATVQGASVHTANGSGATSAEFVKAVQDVLDSGASARLGDPRVDQALQRLKAVVADYAAWAKAIS